MIEFIIGLIIGFIVGYLYSKFMDIKAEYDRRDRDCRQWRENDR